MKTQALTDLEFKKIKNLIYQWAGIHMTASKKALISGRLLKRLHYYKIETYGEYIDIALKDKTYKERQVLIDTLTTNETYFFREDKHFQYLKKEILPNTNTPFHVWSAACSTGAEVYTIGMILQNYFQSKDWSILGSDINMKVIQEAQQGVYNIEMAEKIPTEYLHKYCLKGVRSQEGKFIIKDNLKKSISFQQINLIEDLPQIGFFDVIFLRNVMIYFNQKTKTQVINRLIEKLKKGGYLIVGHAESLYGLGIKIKQLIPTIYQKE